MGYTTDFFGEWTVDPPLTPERVAYLKAFAETRRMKRDAAKAENLYDPIRAAVGLPIGRDGGYYVGASGLMGQDRDDSVIDYNYPAGQPSLWCQWIPSDDGLTIQWDDGEKFYDYVEWIGYLIDHFLKPWGHKLNGEVEWQGEDSDDRGCIRITDNVVEIGYARVGYAFPTTNNTTVKGTNMTASNTKTITATVAAPVPAGSVTLPAPVPAGVTARKAKPATNGTSKNVQNFAAWKDAIGTAQSATGYDSASPIYGKTDIEVLTALKKNLESLAAYATGKAVDVKVVSDAAKNEVVVIDELLKRKVAKQIAGQTYKSRKTV